MEIKKGTISHLQDYMAFKIKERGFEDETLHERLVLLTEEVGELAKACRKLSGMHEEKYKENSYMAGEEVTDVMNMVFAVAIKLGLDIEKEFTEKELKNDKRIYEKKNK
ncbi:MAG: RS21-C6 protein [Candidatus Staskawiczbacteria bacterium]|nr:RS21-C6 protein [Candidatus Staskawiczbacteria bacterium]